MQVTAQKTSTTEKREMFFRITAVNNITNDSVVASINGEIGRAHV